MNEQCWVLVGRFDPGRQMWLAQVRRHANGSPASVDADWAWALAREETEGDVLGFGHTHPPGAGTSPSARDIRTMQAWCSALGKPLLCLIAEGENLERPDGYIFEDDNSKGRPLTSFELSPIE